MANPEHVEWLKEGVEAWNARRDNHHFFPDLFRADLHRIDLNPVHGKGAPMLKFSSTFAANLERTDLRRAILHQAKLRSANLQRANLLSADLREVDLRQANLQGANLRATNLQEAKMTGANVSTIVEISPRSNDFILTIKSSDLTSSNGLTQPQLEEMVGDNGTLLPDYLTRPSHWKTIDLPQNHQNYEAPTEDPPRTDETARGPALPAASSIPTSTQIIFKDDKVAFEDTPLLKRTDLETIYADLQEDIPLLKGRFANVSVSFDTFMTRYATIITRDFNALDQVRFGVQTAALRTRFEAARSDFEEISPDSMGEIEASLLSAELITSRLPDWIAFRKEIEDEIETVEAHAEEIDETLTQAQAEIVKDTAHFDASVSDGLLDYLDTKTVEGYLAGSMMLNAIAFRIATEVRAFTKDTGTEARKIAVKGAAGALVTSLGASLAKLAGIMPAEFAWVIPWLKYIPTIL